MSGNGPSCSGGGMVTVTSSGTPSQVSTRLATPADEQTCPTPGLAWHGTRPPKTLDTVAACAAGARSRVSRAVRTVRVCMDLLLAHGAEGQGPGLALKSPAASIAIRDPLAARVEKSTCKDG